MLYKDFLSAANDVFSTLSSSESGCRSAIHLAYYAAFHACCEALDEVVEEKRDYFKHADVMKLAPIYKTKSKRLYEATICFADLRSLRVKADYKLTQRVGKVDAEDAIEAAERILSV